MIRILLVGDHGRAAESLEAHFRRRGLETVVCATAEDALAGPPCDVVLACLTEPWDPDGIVERVRKAVERGRVERTNDDLHLKRRVRALERDLFQEALRRSGGKKSDAARLLGIDASNWAYHAKRLNLQ